MSIFEGSGTLELKSPLSKECWDKLADVELENTERMWFTTPSGKRVDYIRADVLDKIRAEIEAATKSEHPYFSVHRIAGLVCAKKIIDEHISGKEQK